MKPISAREDNHLCAASVPGLGEGTQMQALPTPALVTSSLAPTSCHVTSFLSAAQFRPVLLWEPFLSNPQEGEIQLIKMTCGNRTGEKHLVCEGEQLFEQLCNSALVYAHGWKSLEVNRQQIDAS